MTRKHFEAMARIIRERREAYSLIPDDDRRFTARFVLAGTAHDMAAFFATENPRFDREKFLTACGIGE